MNKTQRIKAQRALNKIRKCDGNCKECNKLLMPTGSSGRHIFYALCCGIADEAGYLPYTERLADVRKEAIECLQFELS